MKPVTALSDASLLYIAEDCFEAIRAHPQGHSTERYLAEMRACERELVRRDQLRARRRYIRLSSPDPLTVAIRHRRWTARPNAEQVKSVLFSLAWDRTNGRKT